MENCEQHKELPKYYCGTCLDIAESKAIKKAAKKIFEELEKYFSENKNEDNYVIFTAEYFDIKGKFLQEEAKQK